MMLSSAKVTKPSGTSPATSTISASAATSSSLPRTSSKPSPSSTTPASSSSLPTSSQSSRLSSTSSSKDQHLVDHSANLSSASRSYSRDLSRLRRMCPSHQPCVVYSNRELASEIKSIVSAAKGGPATGPTTSSQSRLPFHPANQPNSSNSAEKSHHPTKSNVAPNDTATTAANPSTSKEPNSNKITSTSKPSCAKYLKPTPSNQLPKTGVGLQVRPMTAEGTTPEEKAYIDSFTTHGPGIFSGTFSGLLSLIHYSLSSRYPYNVIAVNIKRASIKIYSSSPFCVFDCFSFSFDKS